MHSSGKAAASLASAARVPFPAEEELPPLLRRVAALCIATHTREYMDELEGVLKHLVKELGDGLGADGLGAKAALQGAETWLQEHLELR